MQARKNHEADAIREIVTMQKAGRWQESIACAQAYAAAQGPHPLVSQLRGMAHEALGQFDLCIEAFHESLSLNRTPQMLASLGALYVRLERPEAALPLLEESVKAQENPRSFAWLGKAYMALERNPEAEKILLRAQQAAPSPDIFRDLGLLYMRMARPEDALIWHTKAVEAEESNPHHWESLAQTYLLLNQHVHAILIYLKIARENPDNNYCRLQLALALRHHLPSVYNEVFREALLYCLDEPRLNHSFINAFFARLAALDPRLTALQAMLRTKTWEEFIQAADGNLPALNDPMLIKGLNAFIVCDLSFERTLTYLRRYLLDLQAGGADMTPHMSLMGALAAQCFLTEYVYDETAQETAQVSTLATALAGEGSWNDVNVARAVLLGCYRRLIDLETSIPLFSAVQVKAATDPVLCRVLGEQLADLRAERALEPGIAVLKISGDETSQKVRAMYEENPYPRWKNIFSTPASHNPFIDLAPLRQDKAGGTLDVLVAGCGTGKHLAICHGEYPNARILGIDLSRASLAYARKRCIDYQFENIDLMQADILELRALDRRFDIIESAGVLHHMADPMAGWRVLYDLLRPGGYMAIGLYSELARQDVVACREIIAREGFPATLDGIRACRRFITALPAHHPARQVAGSGDFYSASLCRDLIFHVQEHRFTIPEIKACLDELNLEMAGFEIAHVGTLARYRSLYPEDWRLTSFENWETFERGHPHTFQNMYQFWCRKPA